MHSSAKKEIVKIARKFLDAKPNLKTWTVKVIMYVTGNNNNHTELMKVITFLFD